MTSETSQKFAWNSSSIVDSKEHKDFIDLAKVLMECSSIEEFEIYRDLILANKDTPTADAI